MITIAIAERPGYGTIPAMHYRVVGLGVVSLLMGCFSEPGGATSGAGETTEDAAEDTTGTTGAGTASSGTTTGGSESGSLSTGPTSAPNTSGSRDTGSTTGSSRGDCVEEVFPGRRATVDVVMVIDGRPAIEDNAIEIRGFLDDLSGVFPRDNQHRLILMSPVEGVSQPFCVGPPLGTASCGESRFPHFVHLDVATGIPESDPLGVLTMELNSGVPEVRPGSHKDLVVITDGDTSITPPNAVAALRSLGPEFANVRIHAVAGGETGCTASPNLSGAAALSFGTSTQLCPLEDEVLLIEELLSSPRSCVFGIPDVIVDEIEGAVLSVGADDVQLAQVGTLLDCSANTPGATITSIDNEQSLVLCPATCAQYQGDGSMGVGELVVRQCE